MNTKIYYFSGTGNSLVLARKLAEMIGGVELVNLKDVDGKEVVLDVERIGIVFPVYGFGVPLIVKRFLENLRGGSAKYIFAVSNCAGNHGFALPQVQELLAAKNITLNASFNVIMPSNYIPFGGAEPEGKQKRVFAKVDKRLEKAVEVINAGSDTKIDKPFLPPGWLCRLIYKFFTRGLKKVSAKFHVNDKCNSCGLCEKICPVNNISIVDGKPQWDNHCELCLACLQWCPREAIGYDKVPEDRKHYHHPDVKPEDLC